MVRSHYGVGFEHDAAKIYRASNALAAWLGLDSWTEIAMMQLPENVDRFKRMVAEAK